MKASAPTPERRLAGEPASGHEHARSGATMAIVAARNEQ
jgi:hypothetical protein